MEKNPRLQLVKIDHVISVYLSLTGKTVRLWTLTFVSWFNHGQDSINSNLWIYKSKVIFIDLLLQRKLSFIREHTQVI